MVLTLYLLLFARGRYKAEYFLCIIAYSLLLILTSK